MIPEDIRLRPCRLSDLDILVEIYHEGFEHELTFFFKRFCRCFFEALFRLLLGDTIVAEVNGDVVGFVVAVLGLRPMLRAELLRLAPTMPVLLASVRSFFFIYILQKLRNMEWSDCQVGIGCIAVKKEWRGRGVGGALIREALARYPERNAILEVRPWNESAVRLYISVGFRRTGAWRDPLGEWVVMRRSGPLS